MHIRKILRGMIATLTIVMVVFGSTGFTLEEHRCSHCGTDYSLVLFSIDNVPMEACHESEKSSCCEGEDDHSQDIPPGSCEISEEDCCEYETEAVKISDPITKVQEIVIVQSPIHEFVFNLNIPTNDSSNGSLYLPHIKPGGRDILILNSQYRT